jgi:hypothetical protein
MEFECSRLIIESVMVILPMLDYRLYKYIINYIYQYICFRSFRKM